MYKGKFRMSLYLRREKHILSKDLRTKSITQADCTQRHPITINKPTKIKWWTLEKRDNWISHYHIIRFKYPVFNNSALHPPQNKTRENYRKR